MKVDELIGLLGEPIDWVGKPPNIGFEVQTYRQSDRWLYFDGSVGMHIKGEIVIEVYWLPRETEKVLWELPCGILNSSDMETWLCEMGVEFQVRDAQDGHYFVGKGFSIMFFGHNKGVRHGRECWLVGVTK